MLICSISIQQYCWNVMGTLCFQNKFCLTEIFILINNNMNIVYIFINPYNII